MKFRIFLLLMCFISGVQAQDREIQFHHEGWEDILAEAEEKDQLVFLDAYASWCGPCKWMAANAFKDNKAADYFNENFVCAKIDMEKGEGVELAKKYSVRAYPTLIFVDKNGEVIHRSVGALDAKNLIDLGNEALNPDMQLSTWDNKFLDGERSPEFIVAYLAKRSEAGYKDLSKITGAYFEQVEESELGSDMNWKIYYRYVWGIDSKAHQYFFKTRHELGERKDSAYQKFGDVIWNSVAPLIYKKETTDEDLQEAVRMAESTGFEEVDKVIYKIKSTHALKTGDWDAYKQATIKNVKKYDWEDARQLNSLAWRYFEKYEDEEALEAALSWANRSVELNEQPFSLDTKAALHYKLGQVKKAIKVQNRAIQLGKEKGMDMSNYEKTLEKYKSQS